MSNADYATLANLVEGRSDKTPLGLFISRWKDIVTDMMSTEVVEVNGKKVRQIPKEQIDIWANQLREIDDMAHRFGEDRLIEANANLKERFEEEQGKQILSLIWKAITYVPELWFYKLPMAATEQVVKMGVKEQARREREGKSEWDFWWNQGP